MQRYATTEIQSVKSQGRLCSSISRGFIRKVESLFSVLEINPIEEENWGI
jgi:hypothetical protein